MYEEDRFTIPDAHGQRAASSPPAYLWLIYLHFRPTAFFTHFVMEPAPVLTALCAWFYGMSGVIDRIDMDTLTSPEKWAEFSWAGVWGIIALGGIVAGALYFKIGGWWYRVRLVWSGAEVLDHSLARRVYIFASMIAAIPTVLVASIETSQHDTPYDYAMAEGSAWNWVLLLFPFWSAWCSYVGVRTVFTVRRGLALLWFLILPGLLYGVVVIGAGAVYWLQSAGPADVADPLHFREGNTLTFSYPGNWWLDTEDDDYDPDNFVSVEPVQSAVLSILVYSCEEDPAAKLTAALQDYGEIFELQQRSQFDSWGSYEGLGHILDATYQGDRYRLRLLVAPLSDGRMLEIHEFCQMSDLPEVQPGFDLIESTFRLRND